MKIHKSFYTIIAVIVLIMVAFFTIKLSSLPQRYCSASYSVLCEMEAFMACRGGDVLSVYLIYSVCDGRICDAAFEVICEYPDAGGGFDSWDIYCSDYSAPECWGN